MKFQSKKGFLYLFLVVAFCVAVSGGCGGGSSSHFSGDYAITSDDVTPEPNIPASDDVKPVPDNPTSDDVPPAPKIPTSDDIPPVSGITPVPEEFTSDDKFGNNDDWEVVSYFSALHNTEWYVQSVNVSVADTFANCTITPNSYNYNANKLKLQVLNDSAIAFIDADEMWRGNWYSPLTVQFKDPSGNELSAPILRAAGGVTNTRSTEYYDMWGVNFGNDGNQLFDIYKKIPPTYIIVYNNFAINNVWYRTIIELRPYNNSANNDEYGGGNDFDVLNSLSELYGSKWTVADVSVHYDTQLSGQKLNIEDNSYNYDVSTITLYTNGDTLNWYDGKGKPRGNKTALRINFTDVNGVKREAPLLRTATGFKYLGNVDDDEEPDERYHVRLPGKDPLGYTNDEYIELAENNYNPQFLTITNEFFFDTLPYSSSLTLKRLNDNPESDDEYGANDDDDWEVIDTDKFIKLDGTKWKINALSIYSGAADRGKVPAAQIVPNSYNYDVSTITLTTFGGHDLMWSDGEGDGHGNTPLTVKFIDPYDGVTQLTARILRSATDFKLSQNGFSYETSVLNADETTDNEVIYIEVKKGTSYTAEKLTINCLFPTGNRKYMSSIVLVPAN